MDEFDTESSEFRELLNAGPAADQSPEEWAADVANAQAAALEANGMDVPAERVDWLAEFIHACYIGDDSTTDDPAETPD